MKSPSGVSGKGVLEPLKRVYTDLKTNMIMFLIIFISLLVPKTRGVKNLFQRPAPSIGTSAFSSPPAP